MFFFPVFTTAILAPNNDFNFLVFGQTESKSVLL